MLVTTLSFTGLARAQQKPALDKKGLTALAEEWWKARPPSRFQDWDPKVRSDLEARARALGPIPEGALDQVVELLWASARKHTPKPDAKKGRLTLPTPTARPGATSRAGARTRR